VTSITQVAKKHPRRVTKIARANMLDLTSVAPSTGLLVPNFSRLTRDQAAAVAEVTVEYDEGKVCRFRFKLLVADLVSAGTHAVTHTGGVETGRMR